MGNIERNDTIDSAPKIDYTVQLSPEGELILWTNQNYTSGYSITIAHLSGKQLIVKWLQHQQL